MTARTVLLTGATGVIGGELLRNLLARGDTVLAATRSVSKLGPVAAAMSSFPGKLVPLEIDLLTADTATLADDLDRRSLSPHHLINNARDIANLRAENGNIPRAQWVAEFDLGVAVPAALTLSLAGSRNSRLKSVVNVSSMYGMVAVNPNLYDKPEQRAPGHYGVAKAALLHLTKELAVQLAPHGVRVNAVSYGGIEGRTDDAFRARYGKLAPTGRMLRLDEVFAPVEFLLADASAVTGHNLVADGGWTLW